MASEYTMPHALPFVIQVVLQSTSFATIPTIVINSGRRFNLWIASHLCGDGFVFIREVLGRLPNQSDKFL